MGADSRGGFRGDHRGELAGERAHKISIQVLALLPAGTVPALRADGSMRVRLDVFDALPHGDVRSAWRMRGACRIRQAPRLGRD